MHIGLRWESRNEKNHKEDLHVGGWVISKWTSGGRIG
jgi:hypothetical protein